MKDDLLMKRLLERGKNSDILVKPVTPEEVNAAKKIFVVGPPRSGTTLIYRLISKDHFLPECTIISSLLKFYDEFLKYGDTERFNYYGHNQRNLTEIFRKPILDFLYTAYKKVTPEIPNQLIFKDPILTLYLGYFEQFFGESFKVVFCVRDPRDTVSSMFNVLKKQHVGDSKRSLFKKAKEVIFPFYYEISSNTQLNKLMDDGKLIFVKYEDIVLGKGEQILALENFLGASLNLLGNSGYTNGKLGQTSAFFTENYEKPISEKSVGKYKENLNFRQILEIERAYSYYMKKFGY